VDGLVDLSFAVGLPPRVRAPDEDRNGQRCDQPRMSNLSRQGIPQSAQNHIIRCEQVTKSYSRET
jgi:hypothetical protein